MCFHVIREVEKFIQVLVCLQSVQPQKVKLIYLGIFVFLEAKYRGSEMARTGKIGGEMFKFKEYPGSEVIKRSYRFLPRIFHY